MVQNVNWAVGGRKISLSELGLWFTYCRIILFERVVRFWDPAGHPSSTLQGFCSAFLLKQVTFKPPPQLGGGIQIVAVGRTILNQATWMSPLIHWQCLVIHL